MQMHHLFPIPIAFFQKEAGVSKKELEFILKQDQRSNMGNTSSKDNYIFERAQLKHLKSWCLESANQYFKEVYQPAEDVKLRITQSWANYTNPGQFHHKHAHPNSIVSGVFYVQTNPGLDRIYFYKSHYQQLKVRTENFNQYNSESWWFDAVEAQLILFPSGLEHMVQTVNEDKVTRVSVSFNTFPVGKMGSHDELTELLL